MGEKRRRGEGVLRTSSYQTFNSSFWHTSDCRPRQFLACDIFDVSHVHLFFSCVMCRTSPHALLNESINDRSAQLSFAMLVNPSRCLTVTILSIFQLLHLFHAPPIMLLELKTVPTSPPFAPSVPLLSTFHTLTSCATLWPVREDSQRPSWCASVPAHLFS